MVLLALIRLIIIVFFLIFICIFGGLFCLIRPFHPNNVHIISSCFGAMYRVFGIKMIKRVHPDVEKGMPAIFIANHQNSYDIFTMSGGLMQQTVSIGKQSLKWIPFFGQIYWLSGNILIDRENRKAAFSTLQKATEYITKKRISVWMFPEGTRSYGKGLLRFKRGAFQLAQAAKVPLVPVVMSSTSGKIKLNKWNNGTIILEIMAPQPLSEAQQQDLRVAADDYHVLMKAKLDELDQEVAALSN